MPADPNPLVDYAYGYDCDGKQTQEVRTGGGLTTRTTSYVYDNLGRLSQVTLPGGTVCGGRGQVLHSSSSYLRCESPDRQVAAAAFARPRRFRHAGGAASEAVA